MSWKKYVFVFIYLFLYHNCISQDEATIDSESVVSDSLLIGEVFIFADVPINKSLPLPIVSLAHTELSRDSEVNMLPSLNRVSGLYVQSGALNTTRITIRGIGNRSLFSTSKIRAYLNDIPISSGIGETTIEDIDMSVIDHIQVYKGPSASLYGAGLGGVIQLVTHPNGTKNSNQLMTRITLGAYGLKRMTNGIKLVNEGQTASLSVKYHSTSSDGYRDNNIYDREGVNILGVIDSGKKNTTTILANYTKVKAFIPSSLNRKDYENTPSIAASNWQSVNGFEDNKKLLIGLSHKVDFGKINDAYKLSNISSLYTNYRDSYESRPFNILTDISSSIGGRTTFGLEKDHSDSDAFINVEGSRLGLEYYHENYQWQTYVTNAGDLGDALSNNREVRSYLNLFLQMRINIGTKIKAIAGLNYNNTHYDYEDRYTNNNIDKSGNYAFEPVISPGLGLSYKFMNLSYLYSNVSHGFSPPTLEETLTPEGSINPDIRPERGWNYEIGSRGTLCDKLNYDVSLYHMSVTDLLVARRVSEDQFVGVNAGKTSHNGLEASVDYQVIGGQNKLSIFSSYTLSDHTFVDFVDGDSDYSGNALTGTARHHLNVGFDFDTGIGLYGNLNYKYLSAFPMRDDNSVYSEAYQVSNLKIGYKNIFFETLHFNIYCGINNLLDEKYASMILINASSFGGRAPRYYYPGLPRNMYFGTEMNFYF